MRHEEEPKAGAYPEATPKGNADLSSSHVGPATGGTSEMTDTRLALKHGLEQLAARQGLTGEDIEGFVTEVFNELNITNAELQVEDKITDLPSAPELK